MNNFHLSRPNGRWSVFSWRKSLPYWCQWGWGSPVFLLELRGRGLPRVFRYYWGKGWWCLKLKKKKKEDEMLLKSRYPDNYYSNFRQWVWINSSASLASLPTRNRRPTLKLWLQNFAISALQSVNLHHTSQLSSQKIHLFFQTRGKGEFKCIFISAVDGAFWFDIKYQNQNPPSTAERSTFHTVC